jgi:hypothetical protein
MFLAYYFRSFEYEKVIMKRKGCLAALAVSIFIILISFQSLAVSISGRVLDESGKPIKNAYVEAFSYNFQSIAASLTNENGEFILDNSTYNDKVYVYAQAFGYLGEYYFDNKAKPNLSDRMALIDDNSTIDFALKKGIQRVDGLQVIVWNGKLDVNFSVYPGYRALLSSVKMTWPDGKKYSFNLDSDFVDASTDCIMGAKWWDKVFDVDQVQYGEYKFDFTFYDGYTISYTKYLKNVNDLSSIDNETADIEIENDGSVNAKWEANPKQYYRLKIKDRDGKKYYFSMPAWRSVNGVHLDRNAIPCLKEGSYYRWAISTYDTFPYPPNIVVSPVNKGYQAYVLKRYNPDNATNRIAWFGVWDWMDKMNASFDVYPAYRERIDKATLTTPDGNVYTFDLQNGWLNLSTESNSDEEFDMFDSAEPINGLYTLSVVFDDGYKEIRNYEYQNSKSLVLPVDINAMKQYPDKYGGLLFEWKLPEDSDQYYDIRIRSLDGTKEYFRKMVYNQPYIYIAPWELKSLTPSKKYVWFMKIWSQDFSTGIKTDGIEFTYMP